MSKERVNLNQDKRKKKMIILMKERMMIKRKKFIYWTFRE